MTACKTKHLNPNDKKNWRWCGYRITENLLEVSRTRHFGRAAESLYLTQSAVSFRIRQLENQLGANLFTRHRNNIRLTPAGERLVPYAEMLLNTWRLAKRSHTFATTH